MLSMLLIAFMLAGKHVTLANLTHNSQYQTAITLCNGRSGLFIGYETPQAWSHQPQQNQRWGHSYLYVHDRLQIVEGPVSETSLWTGACK